MVVTAFVAATALWEVAPFLRLFATYLSNDRVSINGWGRASAAPDVLVRLPAHPAGLRSRLRCCGRRNAAAAVVAARSRPIYRAVLSSEFAVGALATAGGLAVAGMLAADLSWMRHGFTHVEPGPGVVVVGIAILVSIVGTGERLVRSFAT